MLSVLNNNTKYLTLLLKNNTLCIFRDIINENIN